MNLKLKEKIQVRKLKGLNLVSKFLVNPVSYLPYFSVHCVAIPPLFNASVNYKQIKNHPSKPLHTESIDRRLLFNPVHKVFFVR